MPPKEGACSHRQVLGVPRASGGLICKSGEESWGQEAELLRQMGRNRHASWGRKWREQGREEVRGIRGSRGARERCKLCHLCMCNPHISMSGPGLALELWICMSDQPLTTLLR